MKPIHAWADKEGIIPMGYKNPLSSSRDDDHPLAVVICSADDWAAREMVIGAVWQVVGCWANLKRPTKSAAALREALREIK